MSDPRGFEFGSCWHETSQMPSNIGNMEWKFRELIKDGLSYIINLP